MTRRIRSYRKSDTYSQPADMRMFLSDADDRLKALRKQGYADAVQPFWNPDYSDRDAKNTVEGVSNV
jgi:hypothetical protein